MLKIPIRNNMKFPLHNPPLWLVNLTAFGVMLALSLSLLQVYAIKRAAAIRTIRAEIARALPVIAELRENPFETVSITAKAAVVFDVSRNKILYGYHEEDQLPLASLTKLMTAVVAAETLPSYTSIEIVPRGEEYDVRLRVGEKWPLKELLAYTLMTSSNSGADSVAAAASSYLAGRGTRSERVGEQNLSPFVEDMNMKARELELDQTYFLNPSGLDTDTHLSGAYGSAQDVAILIGYIVTRHPDLLVSTGQLEKTFSASDGRNISVKNTNEHVDRIPGLIGSKTGLTDLAGGNLAVAFDASFAEPFVVVVLNSTEDDRFEDVAALVQAIIDYLGSGMKIPSRVSDLPPAFFDEFSYNAGL